MIKHRFYYYLLIALYLLFSGCSSSVGKLYEGPELPSKEVAFIRVFGKDVYGTKSNKEYYNPSKIVTLTGNNKTHVWRSGKWNSIRPGKYRITVEMPHYIRGEIQNIVIKNTTIRREKKLPGNISCSIEFEAEKGRTYIIEFINRIGFPINSGKGIYLIARYAYGTGNERILYDYDYRLTIKKYISGSNIKNGELIGKCSEGT